MPEPWLCDLCGEKLADARPTVSIATLRAALEHILAVHPIELEP